MASINDPRERMANQLLMRGHATMDEILYASFGEWPPKGLDVVGQNNQRITFLPLKKMRASKFSSKPLISRWLWQLHEMLDICARATIEGERRIGINRLKLITLPSLFGDTRLNSSLGHEGVHILQGDHYWRAEDIFGDNHARSIRSSQDNATSNIIANELFSQHTKPQPRTLLAEIKRFLADERYLSYIKKGIEIQACMHEILMAGYQQWGRLPTTQEELLVAFSSAGLKPPQSIMDNLQRSPTIEETTRVFGQKKINNKIVSDIDRNFKRVQATLTDHGQRLFWEETLPAIYVDLIEMYGDKPGRARFNLGYNDRADMRPAAVEGKTKIIPMRPSSGLLNNAVASSGLKV